jgi:hypothetical protein
MSTELKGQRRWMREVLLKFGELEKHQPKPLGDGPDWPE